MSRLTTVLLATLVATAALAGIAAARTGTHAKFRAGKYAGTTSEHSTVTFTVAPGGKRVTAFMSTDGYNGTCNFTGGVGGLANFPVKIAAMTVSKGGAFTGTATSNLGPFSATLTVSGRLTPTGAHGTINKRGAKCGTSSPTPAAGDYLETFTAKRKSSG